MSGDSPLGFRLEGKTALVTGAAAIHLASEAGRHLTGAVLDVNGGLYMR